MSVAGAACMELYVLKNDWSLCLQILCAIIEQKRYSNSCPGLLLVLAVWKMC